MENKWNKYYFILVGLVLALQNSFLIKAGLISKGQSFNWAYDISAIISLIGIVMLVWGLYRLIKWR
jgi:hypothetical protein